MRIIYDQVSPGYNYPLSRRDIAQIKHIVSLDIFCKMDTIRFGCNMKTKQEGRIIQYSNTYSIRINFCLQNFRSIMLSTDRNYLNTIEKFGAIIDKKNKTVIWNLKDAKRYAFFLLFHEIGHIIFSHNYTDGLLEGYGGTLEEKWCDHYAMKIVQQVILEKK